IDPRLKMTEEVKKIDDKMCEILAGSPQLESYHDLRIVRVKEKPVMLLDVVASVGTSYKQIEIFQKEITAQLQKSFPDCTIKVLVEPNFQFTI
ncbi:MAG: hypothetical protein ACE5FU_09455, partial [Nitrospinota bacterium]